MNLIYNIDSFDNAFEVNNYPWGFRLKTKRRYWIETNKQGDRTCFQTLNPKTNAWCAVKHSTYGAVKLLCLDENNHGQTFGIHKYGTDKKEIEEFLSKIDYDYLNDLQKKQICKLKGWNKAMEGVTVKIGKVNTYNLSDPTDLARMRADANSKETLDRKNEQEKIQGQIAGAANYYTKHCLVKNKLN